MEIFFIVALIFLFISAIVLIISAISYFVLKITIKRLNKLPNFDSRRLSTIGKDKIEKKKNKIQKRFYIWGMILSTSGLILFKICSEISEVTFFIPIILFSISIIVRNKNKKVSNIICVIAVALFCLIGVYVGVHNKIIENYNKKFLQYQKGEISFVIGSRYVADIEGLINTTIENNKSDRKTKIVYQDINYTTPDELKQLLSNLNTSKSYSVYMEYENDDDYIESIILSLNIKESLFYLLNDLNEYEGPIKTGSNVESLIQLARRKAFNYEDIVINIVYTDKFKKKTTINLKTDNYENTITNLIKEIKPTRFYSVELQTESDDTCNIIITTNN